MRAAAWMTMLLLALPAARGQSPVDGFDPGASDLVRAIAIDDQGRIYLGGRFTTVSHNQSRARLARLRPDGSLDPGFNPGANGDVTLMRAMANDRLLVAGEFTELGGVARDYIAVVDGDGNVLDEPDLDLDGAVYAYTPTTDGGFAIGGDFQTVNGQPRNRVARFGPGLQLLPDAGGGADGRVLALLAEADGSLLVGGYFGQIGGLTQPRLARLHADGGADADFLPGSAPDAPVWALLRAADGGVLVGGQFTAFGAEARPYMARLTPGGALDAGFAPAFDGDVLAIAEQADGRLVVGGSFSTVDAEGSPGVARLRASGQLDPEFNVGIGANDDVLALALQSDGKLVLGGAFDQVWLIDRFRVARLYPGGQLDRTMALQLGGSATLVRALASAPWGDVVVGGEFGGFAGGPARDNLAYVYANGQLFDNASQAWEQGTDGTIHALLWRQDQGAVYAGGDFEFFDGLAARGIVRLHLDGSRNDSFNAFVDGTVEALAVIGDSLLLAGDFSAVNGVPRSHLAIVDGLGQLDPDFAPEIDGPVRSAAVDASGRILIAGAFGTVNGFARPSLARLMRVGGEDFVDSYSPAPDGMVTAIALDPGQRLYVSGFFDQIGGEPRRGLARLLADGSVDPGLDLPLSPGSAHVRSFGLSADGRVVLGGQFSAIDGVPRANLARIRPGVTNPGSLFVDSTFVADADASVQAVAILPDGKIVVGGYFDEVGGVARRGLARLANRVAALQSFSYYPTTGAGWHRGGSLPELAAPPSLRITANTLPPKAVTMQYAGNAWRASNLRLPAAPERRFEMRGATTAGQRGGSGGALEFVAVRHDPGAGDAIFADGFED